MSSNYPSIHYYLLKFRTRFLLTNFYKRVWSCLIYNASARHEQHECNTSATRVRHEWHECYANDTSVTRVLHERRECDTSEKILILITTWVKIYFDIPISTIWQVKDYKEKKNFILSTKFWNATFPSQNAFENCTTKTELCNGKSYIKSLYSTLQLEISLHSYA